jgi:secreted protein with Ig-like and vWFA domain
VLKESSLIKELKGSEFSPAGSETVSEAGLTIRNTKLGDMSNPPLNPSEKAAVEDWNMMNTDNKISSKLPTGRPSYKLELEGFEPIDIRYPKQA